MERRKFIKSQLDNQNLNYEFITAIYGKKLTTEEIQKLYDKKKAKKYYFRELNPSEIGCALSHKFIYQKMINEGIERAIILEDDITIKSDFSNILEYLENIPINKYLIKLERLHWGEWGIEGDKNAKKPLFTPWLKTKLNNEYFFGFTFNNPSLTWGYYIDLAAAKKMYSIMPKIFLVADGWYYYRKFIRLRILNKPVITNNDELFHSTIQENDPVIEEKKDNNYLSDIINKIHKKIRKLILLIFY